MKWTTNRETFLVQKNVTKIPFVSGGVGLSGDIRFSQSAIYHEMTIFGHVIEKYGEPQPFSIEDEMTVSNIHLVIDDCLYKFYWRQQFGGEPELKVERLLHGLKLYLGVLPFDEENLVR